VVLERRDRVGGACTLERPFRDARFVMSPCAYLVGLLHPIVDDELGLRARGLRIFTLDPTQWTPFDDGTSLVQWQDPDRTARAVAALSPRDVDGFRAYEDLFARIRTRLRQPDAPGWGADTWLGDAPDPNELAARFTGDAEALDVVLHASIADVVEAHVRDPRLRAALHGQGVIGTFAGPRDPGTAWIHAHHSLGLLGGWSYVEGGIGRVSELLAEAAQDAGAVVVTAAAVASIRPDEGVELEDGSTVSAGLVVSNADPVRTLRLLEEGGHRDEALAARVAAWRITSPVVKVNCALSRLPTFPAAHGDPTVHRAQVEVTRGIDETQAAFAAASRGEPAPEWCELYFQTAYDPSVAPAGCHTMSVFAQYTPYELAAGTWATRRDEIGAAVLAAVARVAPDVAQCVIEREVLGPPDVEARIGLTGGHIFQGECLPDQMWQRRFAARTGVPGLYLCGAATHPGGSVMGVNGRNAAQAVLADRAARSRTG
jgi:phytoene dehydrogenase-like protein